MLIAVYRPSNVAALTAPQGRQASWVGAALNNQMRSQFTQLTKQKYAMRGICMNCANLSIYYCSSLYFLWNPVTAKICIGLLGVSILNVYLLDQR